MSFIGDVNKGQTYAPGIFIANGDENIVRETVQVAQDSALVVTSDNGTKHVPAGVPYPTNDGKAVGLLYEDVDVTVGDAPASLVIGPATVYTSAIKVSLAASCVSALEAKGFTFLESAPAVTRPY